MWTHQSGRGMVVRPPAVTMNKAAAEPPVDEPVALSHAARCQNQLGVAFLASLTVDAFAAARVAQARHRKGVGRRGARRGRKFIAQRAATSLSGPCGE